MKQLSPRGQLIGTGLVLASLCWFGLASSYWWLDDPTLPISKLLLAGFLGVVLAASLLSGIICAPVMLAFGNRQIGASRATAALLWLVLVWLVFRSEAAAGFIPERLLTIEIMVGISGAIFGPIVGGLISLPVRLRGIRIASERRQAEIRQEYETRMATLKRQSADHLDSVAAERHARSDEEERRRALRSYFRS